MRTKSNFLNNIKGECMKMRHTLLLWLHLVIPLTGVLVFLLYYRGSSIWGTAGKAEAYLQALAVVYPFLAGIVCALSAELEEAGHYQNFFLLARHKYQALLAKWTVLMFFSFIAVFTAVCGFGAGFALMNKSTPFPAVVYVQAAAVMWLGQIAVYLIHLFLGLQFGKGLSIGVGVMESLISALCLTGLGDGIWPLIPCAWSGRWCSYLLLYTENHKMWSQISGLVTRESMICAGLGAAVIILAFGWFYYYEGRRCQD